MKTDRSGNSDSHFILCQEYDSQVESAINSLPEIDVHKRVKIGIAGAGLPKKGLKGRLRKAGKVGK